MILTTEAARARGSEDKANAYFADGIQDEILTRLAKIADLKVISRTSTQRSPLPKTRRLARAEIDRSLRLEIFVYATVSGVLLCCSIQASVSS